MVHQHYCMRFFRLNNVYNLTSLSCMHALKYSNTLTHLEELYKMDPLNFYDDRDFILGFELHKTCLCINLLDDSLAILKLTTLNFASIPNVNSQLTVISYCFHNGFIR